MKKFDSFTLKIIAIITMLLDHIYTYIGQSGLNIPIWFGYLGKLAAPIFFFLIVEGYFHTSNRFKYLTRLASFGLLMIVIDKVLNINNNIFLSLTLSIIIMMLIDAIRFGKSNKIAVLSAIALIGCSSLYLFTEASIYGLIMTLIFYFCRDYRILLALCYILLSIFPIFPALSTKEAYEQLFLYDYQWMMIFAIIPILMYNGKLGLKNNFTKWLFYIFYPLHLVLIMMALTIV
ncbi:TraX family protein [Metaclostridioides mangenotii]|uniref:TraX family protein n=1 Tax=Metaclostridioides mangenotii TaxID=1540 RepID=UPI000483E136|nr:TraX family protein [Clostridioides mangenotii]